MVARRDDGRFDVATAKGTRFITKTIFIAGGVGAFQPRLLRVDGLDKFDGTQLHYRVRNPAQFAGKNLVIVGGGDSALDWTLNFVQEGPHKAESVILVHRRDGFKAAPASVARMHELCEAYEMQFMVGQITGIDERDGRLSARQGHRRRRRHARGAAGHAAGVLRPVAQARADRRLGPGRSSASSSRSTPKGSRPTCRASSRSATSTPIRARRS